MHIIQIGSTPRFFLCVRSGSPHQQREVLRRHAHAPRVLADVADQATRLVASLEKTTVATIESNQFIVANLESTAATS
jgi:hypothetical protein